MIPEFHELHVKAEIIKGSILFSFVINLIKILSDETINVAVCFLHLSFSELSYIACYVLRVLLNVGDHTMTYCSC